ncbi:MAG: hypothetical protein WBR26_02300 [Candidatus Acidiferrum sp.]
MKVSFARGTIDDGSGALVKRPVRLKPMENSGSVENPGQAR